MQNNTFSTLFIGQNSIKLISIDSTNNYLKQLLSNSEPLPEGTVIMADEQFAGRGQINNVWESEIGKNLTFSIYLKPNFLQAGDQFFLNICISLGLVVSLKKILGDDVKIKWPNDILYKNKKLAGILIENSLQGSFIKQSIVGIGLNVNQKKFNLVNSQALSILNVINKETNLIGLLAEICKNIEGYYLKLKAQGHEWLSIEYLKNLFRFKEDAYYSQNGDVFNGKIVGISKEGKLLIDKEGKEIVAFDFKQIKFLL